jgi:mannitol/fructose-specific phosphotransferase system IIA component (Ntr-type)
MSYWKQFKASSCSVSLKAQDKEAALEEIVQILVKGRALPKEKAGDALQALQNRERLATTGVGMGVAIPHVEVPGLEKVACGLCVHTEGLEWSAVDGAPAHLFFTILRPGEAGEHHDPEAHLDMMRWVARLAREEDFRRFARRAKTRTDLVSLLKEMSAV